MIQVLIIDDDRWALQTLVMALEQEPDLKVVMAASSVNEVLTFPDPERVEVILLDVFLQEGVSFETAKRLRSTFTQAKIIYITARYEPSMLADASGQGMDGFLLKDIGDQSLTDGIRAVHAGHFVVSPTIGAQIEEHLRLNQTSKPKREKLPDLTDRELEILQLMVDGLSNTEIATHLSISVGTVKSHTNRLFAKLNVLDRTQAVVLALARGWIQTPEL